MYRNIKITLFLTSMISMVFLQPGFTFAKQQDLVQVAEISDNSEHFMDTDADTDTKEMVNSYVEPIKLGNENKRIKNAYNRTLRDTSETDPNWFIFNGNRITGYSTSPDAPKDIVIPSSYIKDGITYNVEIIGTSAFAGRQLSSVVLNNNLTEIGNQAFYNNTEITEIDIPDTVRTIGAGAFKECQNLQSVKFSSNLTTLEKEVFRATGVTNITVPNSVSYVDNYAFADCKQLETIILPDSITSMNGFIFQNCSSLVSVKLPSKLSSIGAYTFSKCTSLRSVTLPNTLKTLPTYFFDGCTALTRVDIPDSIQTINASAVWACYNITEITIGTGIKTIGDKAFFAAGKNSADGVKIRFANKKVNEVAGAPWQAERAQIYWLSQDDSCFYVDESGMLMGFKPLDHTSIATSQHDESQNHTIAHIPEKIGDITVTSIANDAFLQLNNLKEVTLPNTITKIGDGAFEGCKGLTQIRLPDSLLTIGDEAFYTCTNLQEVILGEGITTISNRAFSATKTGIKIRLESKKFDSVKNSPWGATNAQIYWKSEDDSCFYINQDGVLFGFKPVDHGSSSQHTASQSHTIANIPREINGVTVKSIRANAFDGSSIKTISIPDSVTSIGEYAFKDSDALTSIHIPDSVQEIGRSAFYSCDSLTNVHLPKNLKTIEQSVFYDTKSLKSIILPTSLISIGASAFNGSGIEYIVIPDSVTSIGTTAFSFSKLKEIVIPDNVTSLGDYIFSSCKMLLKVKLPSQLKSIPSNAFSDNISLTEIVLPESVTSISLKAFYGCIKLKDVYMPSKLTSIGDSAFANCTNINKLVLNEGIQSLGSNIIQGTNVSEITLPSTLRWITTTTLTGYKGNEIFVHQSPSSSSIKNQQPWGATGARVYYDGEYTSVASEISYNAQYNKATIHISASAQTGSIIKSITLPDGTVKNNIDSAQFSFDFDIDMNGEYRFEVYSATGDPTIHNVNIDKIIYAYIDAHSFQITADEIDDLTKQVIIDRSDASAYRNTDNSPLDVDISTSLTDIKAALKAEGANTNVRLYAKCKTPDDLSTVEVEKYITINVTKEYKVIFKDWDGTILKTESVFEGDSAKAPENPKRAGYTFTGWDHNLDNVQEDIVTTAQYTAKDYVVHYDSKGGTPTRIPDKHVTWTQSGLLPANTMSKDHYRFEGWSYGEGTGVGILTDATTYSSLAVIDTINEITLNANWVPIDYTLSFHGNGGTGSKPEITYNIESPYIDIGDPVFINPGSTFEGWNTKMDGTGVDIDDPQHYQPPLENTVLYAQWKEQKASYYVAIPQSIQLKNEENSNYASAQGEIAVIDEHVNAASLPPTVIQIYCDTSITLTNLDTPQTYKANVYKSTGDLYTDSSTPLMSLDTVHNKQDIFVLRTVKNTVHHRGNYSGILTFTIQFGD